MSQRETWASVSGFPAYMVSDHGRVRSRTLVGRRQRGRILRPQFAGSGGHLAVTLVRDGVRHQRYVHILVREAFVPNPEGYPITRHLNGQPTDNRWSNLAPGTQAMNLADARAHGTMPTRKTSKETTP